MRGYGYNESCMFRLLVSGEQFSLYNPCAISGSVLRDDHKEHCVLDFSLNSMV